MKYKVKTWNDTGDREWRDEHYIFADSDEEAEAIASSRWLEDRFGSAAVTADLYAPSGLMVHAYGRDW